MEWRGEGTGEWRNGGMEERRGEGTGGGTRFCLKEVLSFFLKEVLSPPFARLDFPGGNGD